ncbi:MAG: PEP-CTERM sorting domain-containing protein, partial [Planctomycetaceae bacterium]|nr:PEP-CTERM sorting domain-containing protein [Planctomycetaceae bacterium]
YLELVYGDGTATIFDGSRWMTGWGIAATGITYGAEVPEPATLAIIGLGLAGLGVAWRRMKR